MLAWMCVSSAESIFAIILLSVACPVGTYHNASLDVCQYCSRGSYQDLEGQRYCFMCRPGQTSPDGATHKTQCKQ